MSLNKENQLKFDEGKTTEPLTILKAGLEELEFGSKHVVHIKQLIDGYDHFLPSDGLINKIKEANVDVGDVITIEKAPPSDKWKYGYFAVKVVEKNAHPPMHKSDEKFEKQFEPKIEEKEAYADDFGKATVKKIALDLHELTLRAEELEKCVTKLIKEVKLLLGDAGHKPGDENL